MVSPIQTFLNKFLHHGPFLRPDRLHSIFWFHLHWIASAHGLHHTGIYRHARNALPLPYSKILRLPLCWSFTPSNFPTVLKSQGNRRIANQNQRFVKRNFQTAYCKYIHVSISTERKGRLATRVNKHCS